jgi:hypothetical protein
MKRRDFSLAVVGATSAVVSLPLMAQAPAAKKPVEGTDYLSLDKRIPADVGADRILLVQLPPLQRVRAPVCGLGESSTQRRGGAACARAFPRRL